MELVWIIGIAFVLDAIWGDPTYIYHPICAIGNLISKTEKFIRPRLKSEFLGGVILVIVVVSLSFLIPFLMLLMLYKIHMILGVVVEIFWCFQILAANSLRKAALEVYKPLEVEDLEESRKYISYIVGRDTGGLDKKGIIKATVETVAENTTDGVIAPLIFMAVGGAPLAFAYKAINTMDSMVGYKNDMYILFGRCAAKLDDVVNYIPARITAMFMIISAYLLGYDGKGAWRMYWRDRRNHKSPNSAQTESVCAGALQIQLAGNASYFGEIYEKPTIGDDVRPIEVEDIKRSIKLMYMTSVQIVIFIMVILWMIRS